MEKKENQRITLTKRLLQEALLLMLRDESINKISVRDLCEKAGINRTTFYNHYSCPADVLNDISQSFMNGMKPNRPIYNPWQKKWLAFSSIWKIILNWRAYC